MSRRVLPGLPLSLGITLIYGAIIILLPLIALIYKAAGLGFADYWAAISSPRVLASYWVTASSAFIAALINLFLGFAITWVIVRYRFPGRRLLDAAIDLPFALPTAVAGIALTSLLAVGGGVDQFCAFLGVPFRIADLPFAITYSQAGIIIAMSFTSLPFLVRCVQPVLEELDPALEEAGQSLGANDLTIFMKIMFPQYDF